MSASFLFLDFCGESFCNYLWKQNNNILRIYIKPKHILYLKTQRKSFKTYDTKHNLAQLTAHMQLTFNICWRNTLLLLHTKQHPTHSFYSFTNHTTPIQRKQTAFNNYKHTSKHTKSSHLHTSNDTWHIHTLTQSLHIWASGRLQAPSTSEASLIKALCRTLAQLRTNHHPFYHTYTKSMPHTIYQHSVPTHKNITPHTSLFAHTRTSHHTPLYLHTQEHHTTHLFICTHVPTQLHYY